MKIGIFSRSMNCNLYCKAMNCISLPFPRYRYTQQTSDGYLEKLVSSDVDVAINVDEDAFVLDNERLRELLYYVLDKGYANCGMPDGGMPVRKRNPLVTNPFFNIIDVARLRKVSI